MNPDQNPPKGRVSALLAKLKSDKRLLVAPILGLLIIIFVLVNIWSNPPQDSSDKGSNTSKNTSSGSTAKGESPVWEYNQQKLEWFVKSGTAPGCKEPFKLDMTPVDLSQVTAVSLPGAYRGFSYKAHGGFRAADSTGGKVDVKMPMDAYLTGITRYYEGVPGSEPELQYLLDFMNDCGIAFRFDHIYTLTPDLQALAEKTAPPKLNDTSGSPGAFEKVFYKSGQTVATEVGFKDARNYGFDFGVYDYRERNKISGNKAWAAIHKQHSAQDFHGVCWLPMLPDADAAKTEAMAKDRNNYNSNKPFNLTSDYCEWAPYRTLDFNNGQPVDG